MSVIEVCRREAQQEGVHREMGQSLYGFWRVVQRFLKLERILEGYRDCTDLDKDFLLGCNGYRFCCHVYIRICSYDFGVQKSGSDVGWGLAEFF